MWHSAWQNVRRFGPTLGIIAALCLGAFLLYRTLSRYQFDELMGQVLAISPLRLACALGFAAGSYVCLTGFDWLALRYVGRPLAYHRAALASFTALSLGHNIGFSVLSSGAIRYRYYTRWGLSTEEVAKLIVFCGVTVALGLVTVAGASLLLQPAVATKVTRVSPIATAAIGAACLAVPVAYVLLAAAAPRSLRIYKWSIEMPPVRYAALQVLLGAVNYALVAACLHQVLIAFTDVAYAPVATVYTTANALSLVSHVPGGVGVIESTVTQMLPGSGLLGAVLLFRFVYHLVPLGLGLMSFAVSELVLRERAGR